MVVSNRNSIYNFRNGLQIAGQLLSSSILNALIGGGETALHSHVSSGIQVEHVQLTDAQIKALGGYVMVEIIPAPGADKIIKVFGAWMYAKFAAGAYTNVTENANPNSSSLSLVYGDDNQQASGFVATVGLLDSAFDRHVDLPPRIVSYLIGATDSVVKASGTQAASATNQPIKIVAYNSGDYTGGNAANTLDITVWYSILDLITGLPA